MSDPSPTEVSAPRRPADDVAALAQVYRVLAADDLAGYCPIYERIALAMADDPASLVLLLDGAPVGRTPVLAFAATHDLVLSEPDSPLAQIYAGRSSADPWPPFRALLHDRTDEVVHRMRTRSIQTNEVGRSAALLSALDHVAAAAHSRGDDRPLGLVELGPSAGLNLLLDRYEVELLRGCEVVGRLGEAGSTVRLTCELRGPHSPRLDVAPPAIASRVGLDLSPVDVTDDDACRWLSACVWPGVPDRPERLAAAIALARLDPPRLVAGDAVTDLAPLVAALPDDVLPVVQSTWALAYLGREGRAAVLDSLDRVGATRDLVLVTAEEPRSTPWIPEVPPAIQACGDADGDGTATVLGARTWREGSARDEVLALCHPHLRWMAWIPEVGR